MISGDVHDPVSNNSGLIAVNIGTLVQSNNSMQESLSQRSRLMRSRVKDQLSDEDPLFPYSTQLFSPDIPVNGPQPSSYPNGPAPNVLPLADDDCDVNYLNNPSTSGATDESSSSSSKAEQFQVFGNLFEFPFPSLPYGHDARTQLPAAEHVSLTSPWAVSTTPLIVNDPDYKKNPKEIRKTWRDDYSRFCNSKVFKIGKHATEGVMKINTLEAMAARRRLGLGGPAKFKCPIEGCGADFTRKHNLENQLKSHCGVTDRICDICGAGFTTIPVRKRHWKTWESTRLTATPKRLVDAYCIERS